MHGKSVKSAGAFSKKRGEAQKVRGTIMSTKYKAVTLGLHGYKLLKEIPAEACPSRNTHVAVSSFAQLFSNRGHISSLTRQSACETPAQKKQENNLFSRCRCTEIIYLGSLVSNSELQLVPCSFFFFSFLFSFSQNEKLRQALLASGTSL